MHCLRNAGKQVHVSFMVRTVLVLCQSFNRSINHITLACTVSPSGNDAPLPCGIVADHSSRYAPPFLQTWQSLQNGRSFLNCMMNESKGISGMYFCLPKKLVCFHRNAMYELQSLNSYSYDRYNHLTSYRRFY